MPASFSIFPFGDNALIVDFGESMEIEVNKKVHSFFRLVRAQQAKFIIDVVPAYSSIAIYYDTLLLEHQKLNEETFFDMLVSWVEGIACENKWEEEMEERIINVPVLYHPDVAPDLAQVLYLKDLSLEAFIQLHTSVEYHVYMLGFLPGFPYMGKVDPAIELPRRKIPRKKVEAGSVGIAGRQTGIYSLDSPGGWQIIGKTPLQIFDSKKDKPVLFNPGDKVKFHSISANEYKNY